MLNQPDGGEGGQRSGQDYADVGARRGWRDIIHHETRPQDEKAGKLKPADFFNEFNASPCKYSYVDPTKTRGGKSDAEPPSRKRPRPSERTSFTYQKKKVPSVAPRIESKKKFSAVERSQSSRMQSGRTSCAKRKGNKKGTEKEDNKSDLHQG